MSNIPKGYKQTDVGVIPEDWEVRKLGEYVKITSGESPSKFRFKSNGVPYFKVEQLNNSSKYQKETPYRVETTNTVSKGSIIFPKRGASILMNKIRILEEDSFMDTNLMTLSLSEGLSNEYLFYILAHHELWRIADTTSIPQINNKHITPFLIPIPPTKVEQTDIAATLNDADLLINSLEKLIAKKRNIKQGAMQKLFKPKEGWVVRKLGEIGSFSKGAGIRKDESFSGTIPCIRYGEIYTRHNDYIKEYFSFISTEVSRTSKRLKAGDLLFAGSGETKEEIGKCVAFIENIEAYAGGDIVIFSPQDVDSLYLGYYLNMPAIVKQKASRGQGDAVVHISAASLKEISISLPTKKSEQTAIAQILSDMDSEIDLLEQKLAKYRMIKQGMMLELLTGRIRLV